MLEEKLVLDTKFKLQTVHNCVNVEVNNRRYITAMMRLEGDGIQWSNLIGVEFTREEFLTTLTRSIFSRLLSSSTVAVVLRVQQHLKTLFYQRCLQD